MIGEFFVGILEDRSDPIPPLSCAARRDLPHIIETATERFHSGERWKVGRGAVAGTELGTAAFWFTPDVPSRSQPGTRFPSTAELAKPKGRTEVGLNCAIKWACELNRLGQTH